jgi:hypothetical protein
MVDRYTKAVLTIIAVCLLWDIFGSRELVHPVSAQNSTGIPQRVIIVGVDGGALPVGIVGFQASPLPVFIQGVGGTIPVHSQ